MKHKRDASIDTIKCIGLIGLMASHIFTNNIILQIRSFDVNLLIIISAYLADHSNEEIGYTSYLKKRFKRLLLPTWTFITIYLVLNEIFNFQEYTLKQMVRSYLLLNNSIGYVWIIYVYIICAIITPFLRRINYNDHHTYFALSVIFIAYGILVHLSNNYIYQLIILYPIVYSLISVIGILISRNKDRVCNIIEIFGFFIFIIIGLYLYKINNHFIVTGEFKYPPKLYYLSYSIGFSILLFKVKNKLYMIANEFKLSGAILFMSKHSLWIYLWHILGIQLASRFCKNSIISLLLVLNISILLTYLQNKIIDILDNKHFNKNALAIFRG